MTAANLGRSLEQVFGHEGGFTRARADPGNWTGGKVGSGRLKGTKYGIAANSYPRLDIANLTLADATRIYERDYAAKVAFDALPAGVDHAVLDFAINSGPSRAAKFLQRVAGVEDDGRIGPVTLAAVRQVAPDVAVDLLCDARLEFLRGLAIWATYGKGWTRRVEEVRAFAHRLAAEQGTAGQRTAEQRAAGPAVTVQRPNVGPQPAAGLAALIANIIAAILRGA